MSEKIPRRGKLIIDGYEPVEGEPGMFYVKTHIDMTQPADTKFREMILSGDYDPLTRMFIEEAFAKADQAELERDAEPEAPAQGILTFLRHLFRLIK